MWVGYWGEVKPMRYKGAITIRNVRRHSNDIYENEQNNSLSG
jgi:hypothetical protein